MLVNGEPGHALSLADRGLQYGDGLFETILVKAAQPVFLQQHLDRLQNGCQRLLIPCPNLDLIGAEISQVIQEAPLQAVLKIIVTRGSGGRGYRQPEPIAPTRIISLHPYPNYPAAFKQVGVVVRFCQIRLGCNPALAGIKHLNRLEQVLARAEWHDPAIQEGLMLDSHGRVIEGTMSNLFWVKNHILFTAPLLESGVAGIMRAHILQLARCNAIPVKEQYIESANLLAADELFLTNSLIGIWPVQRLGQHLFSLGAVTRKLMAMLEENT